MIEAAEEQILERLIAQTMGELEEAAKAGDGIRADAAVAIGAWLIRSLEQLRQLPA